MASCNYKFFAALPLCVLAIQSCGNSPAKDSLANVSVTADDPFAPAEDGDSLQANDGTEPLEIVSFPGNDPETMVVIGPEGDSNLRVNDRSYPLDAALGDVWDVQGEHFNVNYTLTNGKFIIMPTRVGEQVHDLLVPAQATAVVYAEMFSPGDQFSFVTYSYSSLDASDAGLAGNAFFINATVGFDVDRSGDVDEDETLSVVGGTIEFTGILPDIEIHFSVTLDNGLLAEGHYTGLFDFTNR